MKIVSLQTTALAGAGALALISGAAQAQPDSGPGNSGPGNSGPYDWTGVYVGLNTGWNDSHAHVNAGTATVNQLTGVNNGSGVQTVPATTIPTPSMNLNASGWAGGGQVGVNKQFGQVVLGLEGDMDAVGGRSSQGFSATLPATSLTTGSNVAVDRTLDPQWTATVRGRVGWATGPALLYATGGLAIADTRQSTAYGYAPTVTAGVTAANPGTTFGPFSNVSSDEQTRYGWVLGAGGEYALNKSVSIGAEYRHADYGRGAFAMGANSADSVFESPRIGGTDDQVLAKVNFRFGSGMF